MLQLVRRVEGWLAVTLADASRRAEELHTAGSGRLPTQTLQGVVGLSKREAHAAVAQAATLRASPALMGGLASGAVTVAHVDAYRRAVAQAPVLSEQIDALVDVATPRATGPTRRRRS